MNAKSKQSFTPGPCKAHENLIELQNVMSKYGGREVIGTIAAGYEHFTPLFAAAPELLEACKNLIGPASTAIQGTTDGTPILRQARAAIAKAEGLSNVSEANIARAEGKGE